MTTTRRSRAPDFKKGKTTTAGDTAADLPAAMTCDAATYISSEREDETATLATI